MVVGVVVGFRQAIGPVPLGMHVPPAGLDVETLGAAAGLYQGEDGARLLLAPSAGGGFSLFRAGDLRFAKEGVLATDLRPGDRLELATEGGRVAGLEWRDAAGHPRAARRLTDPPYTVRAVEFAGEVALSGTVFLPAGPGPFPAAVLIHGSGTSDRDGLWYVLIARALAEGGIAVLLPDKRGSGRSSGEWRTASFDDLAGDALAALEVLAAQPGVDRARLGLVGLSQGGWVAISAAKGRPQVAFVVNTSGSAVTPREQTRHEIRQQLADGGLPRWLVPAVLPLANGMPARWLPVWWEKNGDFDPIPVLEALPQPVLVVYGALDEAENVPVSRSVSRLREVAARKPDLTVRVLEGVGHALVDPASGELSSAYQALLTGWIAGGAR